MAEVTPSRRERLRAATITEIKAVARRLLVAGGPAAISLRAIAREMGMTAPAIYRYFASLEELNADLCLDLYAELNHEIAKARQGAETDDPLVRLFAMARAYRRWCVAHRAEFAFMFGAPVPGVPAVEEQCADDEHHTVYAFDHAFLDEFVALAASRPLRTPPPGAISPELIERFTPYLTTHGDPLLPEEMYLFLSAWVRLYGMVALEVFGHLAWAIDDAEALFETELATFVYHLTGELPGDEIHRS